MIRIETERLTIRNFQESDASDLLEYLSHPRVNCFLSEKLNSLEEAIENVKQKSNDELEFAVCLKENNKVVGNLFAKKEEPDTYGVGWQYNEIIEGKGYAGEAAKAYLTYLFNIKSARRIYAYVEETNLRSQKLCERLGMRKEGCFKEFISFTQNQDGIPIYENTIQYALLKKEWDL
ncbi:MAG: GNAT family protein [Dysgonomonas sp.]